GQVSKVVQGTLIDDRTKDPIEDEVGITLRNVETNQEFHVESNNEGKFAFNDVPYGQYEFKVDDKDYTMANPFRFEINTDHSEHFTFSDPIPASLKVSWLFNWGDRTITDEAGNPVLKEHYWSHFV